MDLRSTQLSTQQREKVTIDLQTIKKLLEKGKELDLRIIISGGYAVDGFLHAITRYHDEIDVQIYGQGNNALDTVTHLLESMGLDKNKWRIQDKGRNDYYHNYVIDIGNLELDIYYLQTKNSPFEDKKIIVKANGSLTESHPYSTQQGKVAGVSFEIQDPLTEVTDKIYKREHRGDPKYAKHEQDIENMEKIIPEHEIQERLKQLIQ